MIKHFNKELVMTKEENLKNTTIYTVCKNVDNDVKVKDHCHITGKYRGSASRDCSIKLKLNRKIHIVFCNLNSYDFHLIMQ